MKAINPYLNFKGTTEEAFNFYKSVFGGEFTAFVRFGEMPGCDGMPAADKEKLMHVSLALPNGTTLMATDVTEGQPFPFVEGNNISLAMDSETFDEGRELCDALAAGGKTVVPFNTADWGGYFGMVADKYGINWMVSFDENKK